jgi:2-polyprenyl-3-methyl-5-hydroxy-6-metoxy-1,4-benzoquinol methylase
MATNGRPVAHLRARFDEIYDTCIVGAGFFESDNYYRNEKERYWRSLELLCRIIPSSKVRILEIGGGQLALLCKTLFGDECTVADISKKYIAPIDEAGIEFITFNLTETNSSLTEGRYDVVVLLEVIEHVPLPGYVVMERLKPLLEPGGFVFMTTRNLFRLRNLVRMFLGNEFLDHFMLPEAGQNLGHQLEYSAEHLRWQLQRAGMEVAMLELDSLGRSGHSAKARWARRLLAPLELRPIWRDGLVAVARKPGIAAPIGASSSAPPPSS